MNGQTNTNEQKKKKNRKKERMNEGKGKSEEWRRNEGKKKEKERKKRKLISRLPNKSYNSSLSRHCTPPPNPNTFWTLQLSNSHDL